MKCKIEDCNRNTSKGAQGLCGMHYLRWTRYGRLHSIVNRGSGYTITSSNYVLLELSEGKRQYEHIILAEKALGKKLPKGAIIHHTGEPWDNHGPFKLIVCPNQAYHLLLHRRAKELGYENY